jgi:hypothetical protein
MEISFITLVLPNAEFYRYDIPLEIREEITKNHNLATDKEYVFSFGRFVEFNVDVHGKIITYFFSNMIGKLSENKCMFENDNEIELNKNQLLFLCCVFNKLLLNSYLKACVMILVTKYHMELSDIKLICKVDEYNLTIFVK